MLMYFFARFLESHHVYDQTRGIGIVFSWLYRCRYRLTDSNKSHVREVSIDCFNSTLKRLQNILIWTVWLEKAGYMCGVCTGQTQDHSSHNASLWRFVAAADSSRVRAYLGLNSSAQYGYKEYLSRVDNA
jgi:hypothetical protein